jgi:cytochrome c biogenesis protein CcmG/thiol:disulfide interchange protein DsbE
VAHETAPEEVAVIGVAMDEGSLENVRKFVQVLRMDYPIALPEPMSQMSYGMNGLPTTLLVDRNGAVARTYVGAVRKADLRNDIRVLLKEPAH